MESYEDIVRQLEEERARRQEETARRLEAETRAEQERREKEETQARLVQSEVRLVQTEGRISELEQATALTTFLDYVRHAEEQLYSTFYVEPDSSMVSSGTVTRVDGKFYPRFLRPWENFAAAHVETFNTLAMAFGDQALFPSLLDVGAVSREMSPTENPADEQDIRPFIRTAIERPAARIASRYLADFLPESTIAAVKFRNNAYGVLPAEEPATAGPAADGADPAVDEAEPPRKRRSPVKEIGIPDRWGFAVDRKGKRTRVFVGEYKAAHKLTAKKLRRVMSANPGDDFFPRAIKEKPAQNKDAPADGSATQKKANISGHVSVAYVLCQAYHYMITSGLSFGYISSGDGLIFLRVGDDPCTLYYYWSVFPVAAIPDQAARREANIGARTPQETAVAHVTSFCLWAVDSAPKTSSWMREAQKLAKRWPTPYEEAPRSLSIAPYRLRNNTDKDQDDDDVGGGGPGGPGGEERSGSGSSAVRRVASQSGPLKRGRSPERPAAQDGGGVASDWKFVVEPPTLPYCTQACLLGLCRGLALDDKCPNVALHRAARRCHKAAFSPRSKRNKRGGAPQTKPSQKPELPVPDEHALTAGELEALVVAQVATNVDKDIECLDKYGFYGRYGTLFKITVTGYGYTFVAKGVQAAHVGLICEEAAVYDALAGVQGRLIPVCLGLIDVEPIPLHTCAEVAHLLLLSYAGPDLASPKKDLPPDVDLEREEERTTAELEAAGLWNDDVREPNLAWNAEVQRVMQFDFDQAYVRECVAPADRPADRPVPVSTGTRSPLVDKRDTNAHRGSDQGEDAGPPAKRIRTAGEQQGATA